MGDLLGFTLNLREGSIHVPPERIARLRERITLVSNGNPIAQVAAGVVGMVVSWGLALRSGRSASSPSPPRQLGKFSFGRTAFITAMVDQFGTQIRNRCYLILGC